MDVDGWKEVTLINNGYLVEAVKLQNSSWKDVDVESLIFIVVFVFGCFLFVCKLNVFDFCNSMESRYWVGFCDEAILKLHYVCSWMGNVDH